MLAAILICGVSVFTACTSNKDNAGTDEKSGADLVVIGKIFTSENNQVAEAFAVKNGKTASTSMWATRRAPKPILKMARPK